MAVSHAIEQAVLSGPLTAPTVAVALFQRLAYFEREYAVYEQMAAAGAVVIIGFSDGEAHQVPPGCHAVVLDPHEPLADEWTVIAVGPQAGAFLVATDAHRFDPTEATLEAGREFSGRWGFSRTQAGNELARMRAALGTRLDAAVGYTLDRLLAEVMPVGAATAVSAGSDGERWATASLHRMVARMQDARAGTRILRAQLADAHAAITARTSAQSDRQSGLATPEFLARWADTGGPTALPVGVAVFDVAELDDAELRFGSRVAYHAARQVAAALTEPLGPVDAAVRLSPREFALIVPGASARHLRGLVGAASEQLAWASEGYPGIDLAATVAWCVTLSRPLPLADLHLALGALDQPAATLGDDPITVSTTAAVASGDAPAAPAAPAAEAGQPATAPAADAAACASGSLDNDEPLPQRRVQATPSTDHDPNSDRSARIATHAADEPDSPRHDAGPGPTPSSSAPQRPGLTMIPRRDTGPPPAEPDPAAKLFTAAPADEQRSPNRNGHPLS